MPRNRTRAPLIAFAAITGVVLGHWIAYVVAVPGVGARDALLAETGHGYWPTAVALAVVFGIAATAGTVVRHLTRGIRRDALPAAGWERYRSTALRLASLQASVFAVQEVVERLGAGAPLAGLAHDGFIVVGLAVQVLVAAALALLLVCLGRTAEAIGRAITPTLRSGRTRTRFVLPPAPALRATLAGSSRLTRAPPTLATRIA
jgi:hypothetical protein